ncbi:hypothetical protein GDO86_008225 [Hymenochirus boettgeri]|uniref:Uncharacterized protein n=1 Tax=Hymenochirus boettgeri TaxID=247094 RepID=A0A8T2IWR3_9PIPI|nr:hypothetical protein GDO86_008225 [Hymenochirus boettgeri]
MDHSKCCIKCMLKVGYVRDYFINLPLSYMSSLGNEDYIVYIYIFFVYNCTILYEDIYVFMFLLFDLNGQKATLFIICTDH